MGADTGVFVEGNSELLLCGLADAGEVVAGGVAELCGRNWCLVAGPLEAFATSLPSIAVGYYPDRVWGCGQSPVGER